VSDLIGYLVQKIVWVKNGEEVDRSFLKEMTYTETIDLSGPRLTLMFNDPDSILTDSEWLHLKIGDILEVTFEDTVYRDRLSVVLRFTIVTIPRAGDTLTINCFQEDVYRLKQPTDSPILFTHKSVRQILGQLIPDLGARIEPQIDSFPILEDYHLLPGQRPSLLVRQMAMEQGAMAFFSRNRFYFRSLETLRDAVEERIYYEWNNNNAENQIVHVEVLNVDEVIRDRVVRQYIGWNMEQGFVRGACNYPRAPVEFAGSPHKLTLTNLLTIALPVLDLTMIGDGRLEPGLALEFGWHVDDKIRPFNESLPTCGVVGAVSHYCAGNQYHCRAKIVIPLNESQG
jgi:hypothetical protein